jgi:hypothetical protein
MAIIKAAQTALRWLFRFSHRDEIEIIDKFHLFCIDEGMPITVENIKVRKKIQIR